jgi:hypothetical protein
MMIERGSPSPVGNGTALMAMENRTRLFRVVRWIPYVLAILFAILHLILVLWQGFEPFEGSIPYLYETVFYAFMSLMLVSSAFVKGAVRSVLTIISCTSVFSTSLISLLGTLRSIPARAHDGGPISIGLWIAIACLGLFFIVVAIEAVSLIRRQADRS